LMATLESRTSSDWKPNLLAGCHVGKLPPSRFEKLGVRSRVGRRTVVSDWRPENRCLHPSDLSSCQARLQHTARDRWKGVAHVAAALLSRFVLGDVHACACRQVCRGPTG